MPLLTSGISTFGRQTLLPVTRDRSLTLYLPTYPPGQFERQGGIEALRLKADVPTGRAQQQFIPIYVDSTYIILPEEASQVDYAIGAIWYFAGIPWEMYS